MALKSANQRYKESGSTLPFTQWLNREKAKGVIIPQKGITDKIENEVGDKLKNPVQEKDKNKVFGLDKNILLLSAVIILGAVAYRVYKKNK
tara:strand:+ start:3628 stop:3900 length:273 start_codon:yes stop_codon:yes gene_type:complete